MTEAAIRSLAIARRDPKLVILEGFHALKHAIRFGAQIRQVFAVDPEALESLASALAVDLQGEFLRLAIPIPRHAFRQLAKNVPHTEVIAIAERPDIDSGDVLADATDRPIVFLEDPRNLGNVGAVVRVAAAADAAGVLTSGMHDPWDPLAVRGSAGLHYAVPVVKVDRIAKGDRPLVAVDPEGTDLSRAGLPRRSLLAFGTERYGLGTELLDNADFKVRIPMRPGVSSLNLATSVAVLLYNYR